ncbi:MAG: hypothetical protein GX661_00620, partial [Acholeplasmataceae bacterium]|nr:hypothetical protein [Acholeplasmataceae bacterium]
IIGFLLLLYLTSKTKKNKTFSEMVQDVKNDLKTTLENAREIVGNIRLIKPDELIIKMIKELILNVEEENNQKKSNGQPYLSGAEKKQTVINKVRTWLERFWGSQEEADNFLTTNIAKIEETIEDYVGFTNQMLKKTTKTEEQ